MAKVTLTGQFCYTPSDSPTGCKTGVYAKLEFDYVDGYFHPPVDYIAQLDKQWTPVTKWWTGETVNDWDRFEVITFEHNGVWHQSCDYSDNLVIQLNK
jgi:hypothetical protein